MKEKELMYEYIVKILREREDPRVSHECSNEAGASNKSLLTCVNKEYLVLTPRAPFN